MKRYHLQRSALLLVCGVLGGAAQQRPEAFTPVHWSAEAQVPSAVHAGTRFSVLLHATIDQGWHLYALPDRDASPLATDVALARNDAADLLRVDEEQPHHIMDAGSNVVTAWFAQSATFTLRLAATGPQRPEGLQVLVRYQACNDRMCLPLKDAVVPVPFSAAR